MIENWTLFGIFIAVNVFAAMSGALFPPGDWYKTLNKPPWTPPDWLFAPAWTLLFVMIAYSGYRFTIDAAPEERLWPLVIYGVQLALNAGWSALFFGAKRMDLAFYDAVAMALAIVATIVAFAPASPLAAALLIPYLCWVIFAAALNHSILRRNVPSQRAA